jgi:ribosome-associated protein
MEELSLDGREFIALCDLLKRTGMCDNGGHAKAMIGEGLVKVNDNVELKKRCKITVNQVVEYNGQSVKVLE